MDDYLQKKITVFKDIKDIENPRYITVKEALDRIKKGGKDNQTKDLCQKIQRETDKEKRSKLKGNLVSVLFTGKFDVGVEKDDGKISYRDNQSLGEHSGLVVLDWDDIEPYVLKPKLKADHHIFACWTSPSGNGVKALVKIQNPNKHAEHYNALIADYSKYGELDTSNRNVGRVCYESYDPTIFVNPESWVYAGVLAEKKQASETSAQGLIDRYDYSKLNICCKMIRNSQIGNRNNTLLKASRLAGGYISAGHLPPQATKEIILREYEKVNPEEATDVVVGTIERGIAYGLDMPVYDFEKEERVARQEVGEAELDFIVEYDEVLKRLIDYRNGVVPENWGTGWANLDTHFIWKPRSFYVNLGIDNVGKTYMSFYLMMATAMNHGWKHIIYSAENTVDSQIRDMMMFAASKKVKEMTDLEFKHAYEFVREHFEFIDNKKTHTYLDILDMANKMLSRKSYNYMLIDPYNSLSRKGMFEFGNNAHEYDNEAASNMLSWCKSGDTGIFLNIHTNTEAKRRRDGKGHAKKPFKDDSEGGGKWANKADFFTITHRITNHEEIKERYVTDFSVEKVRDGETGGDVHSYNDPFQMKLMYGTYFVDHLGGRAERPFQPLKTNINEL